ncbi:MAG TPA: helix-turn-helix transcriptional regulator [Solirubrobacterales bacterium]|nr:helix-turn-helix transcriptional regulator [Solirubrobacterales bacterium]
MECYVCGSFASRVDRNEREQKDREEERELFRQETTRVFAENLKREREAAGLTQEALGALADLDRTHVGYLERKRRTPEVPTVRRLAEALGISSGRLVDPYDPNKAPSTDD